MAGGQARLGAAVIRRLLAAALLCGAAMGAAETAQAERILFVGNSFTFGANSAVQAANAGLVTDLNGGRIGGVPGLFARFAAEAGRTDRVALETAPGRTLAWHLAHHGALFDRAWDVVVLQQYSTLDPAHPGDPASTVADARAIAQQLRLANPAVRLVLTATWGRPDLALRPGSPWSGRGVAAMAADLRAGMDRAAAAVGGTVAVAPVGQAFACAVAAGVADGDPYDGIAHGQLPLWSWDDYHASAYGYYLEALVLFGRITGRSPTSLGADEAAAGDLGFAPAQAVALQHVATATLAGDGRCSA